MTCQFEEYPNPQPQPQAEETTRQLIHKLEQRIHHLERDVKRLNRRKSLLPSSPILNQHEPSTPLPPPPPVFGVPPPPPPPPPIAAPAPPLKFTITKKSHSQSAEKKPPQPKQTNMPAVSLQDISNVKLKRVSIANNSNNKSDPARPEISTLRKPLVPLHRQPPSPRGLATVTMKLRKVEKSPGGTPLKLPRVLPIKHSPKRLSTSPTVKNIKHTVNDENTPIDTNQATVQITSPVKQPQVNIEQPMLTSV
eukprot:CAMPEP_0168547816 /NCGR_PEP_ID=MMETSP0413-20121227/4234_1 /TAXON_ID=136452 /ORGANISM="Filamoeba nolandi, Strain NC-AS-23-1" /LENGTH=250 /DNA_ID=CAMNT_0008578087 /DNA_START=201 /DNA_END=953 /DNA_ORIENTATION=-